MLTRPNRAGGEDDHLWPEILPGGQAVLFTITATTGGLDQAQVAVLDLFYLSVTGALMRVGVALGPTWAAATKLFEGRYGAEAGQSGRTYDIAPDGTH